MPRKKAADQDKLLNRSIFIRMNEKDHQSLEKIVRESNCRSVSEAARKILFKNRISYFHKDISMNGPMEELASIRKELKAIGININQITKAFHTTSDPERKYVYSMKAFNKNQEIEEKADRLLEIVSQLTLKWLQK
ncbi:MAG: plasmid mobilization relaxosome protein MobC [Daejeonella sp.]